ncbi:MAG TPA: twin-arginine translocase TatA/TatE family subunit [Blastocatellia bacterium]|nr:twin-arginine translocase TatA/TatE family subunit [Blastocatellia bacterium]
MGNLGWTEILVILVIALIIFGPRKLPELGKSLGQSLAQFRRASDDFKRTWEEEVEVEKRRLEAPPPMPAELTGESFPTVSQADPYWPGSTEQESSPAADEATAAVQESETGLKDTKRDWM